LTHPRILIIGANLKFDLMWIRKKYGIVCTNFVWDTLVSGTISNENRSNSLDWHAREYSTIGGYEVEFNDQADKAHMEKEVDKPGFLVYAGGDPDATLQSAFGIKKELLARPKELRFYEKVLHPAVRTFENIEYRGVLYDPEEGKKLRHTVLDTIEELTEEALKQLPVAVRAKYADDLKLTRPVIIRDAFFSKIGWSMKPFKENLTKKTGQPQTSMDHLKKFSHHPKAAKFIKAKKRLGSAEKTLGTYIDGFEKHLRPDGMFHPTYVLYRGGLYDDDKEDSGSTTGRLAAKDPSINTLTKRNEWAKPLRRCYPAPSGYWFWQLDFSQGELRVIACLANEEQMIKAYKEGIDLHAKTAAQLNEIDLEEFLSWKPYDHPKHADYEKLRFGAKAANFGLLYGMKPKGFVEYAYNEYDVVMSVSKATEFREKFLEEIYPGLSQYHEDQENFVYEHAYVGTPLGRVRHLPLIESPDREAQATAVRQAINAPTQITLNDIALMTATAIDNEFAEDEDRFSIRGSTHDALYGYVRKEDAEECYQRAQVCVEKVQESLPEEFDWTPQLTFPVDWEQGPNWAELQEIKLAA
jgi:DNA polymerase I-like protein with 3'-5' exonuclease and polymerase domains